MMLLKSHICFVIVTLISLPILLNAQKPVDVAVPFLLIAPDARSSAIGDVGVATSADIYAMHWNAAKYAFIDAGAGVGLNYTPYMKDLIQDRALVYLSGFYRVGKTEAIAASLKYFSFGKVSFFSETGEFNGDYTPGEWAVDAAYVKKLSPDFSLSTTFRFIYSGVQAIDNHLGNQNKSQGVAADLGAYYTRDLNKNRFSMGMQVANIGPKMRYNDYELALPTSLRFGLNYTLIGASGINFSINSDVSRLLVKSFGRIDNFSLSSGAELMIREILTLRGGYHYEKNTRYLTTGVGFKYHKLTLDVSYLISTQDYVPAQNALRFGLAHAFKY